MIEDFKGCIRSWSMDHHIKFKERNKKLAYERVKDRLYEFGLSDLSSNWSKEDFAVLVDNQLLIEGESGISNRQLGKFLSQFAAPFLCDTMTLMTPTDLVYYKKRRDIDVIESEEFITKSRMIEDEDYQYLGCYQENNRLIKPNYMNSMVDAIDTEIISDLAHYAATVCKLNLEFFDSILDKLYEISNIIRIKIIDQNAKIYILGSVPMMHHIMRMAKEKPIFTQCSKNLQRCEIKDYMLYATNLMLNDNVLLMGTLDYCGYVFAPQILACGHDSVIYPNQEPEKRYGLITTYAKRFLREGAKAFATITIE